MRLLALLLLAAVAVTLGVQALTAPGSGSAPLPAPPTAPRLLAVGEAAPRFELRDELDVPRDVPGASARWKVVTFFSRAGTPW